VDKSGFIRECLWARKDVEIENHILILGNIRKILMKNSQINISKLFLQSWVLVVKIYQTKILWILQKRGEMIKQSNGSQWITFILMITTNIGETWRWIQIIRSLSTPLFMIMRSWSRKNVTVATGKYQIWKEIPVFAVQRIDWSKTHWFLKRMKKRKKYQISLPKYL